MLYILNIKLLHCSIIFIEVQVIVIIVVIIVVVVVVVIVISTDNIDHSLESGEDKGSKPKC